MPAGGSKPGDGRGRKRKPTALKLLTGNPGGRPLPEREPKFAAGLPPCPAHLPARGKTEWHRVGKMLAAQGVMTHADRAVLASYCQAWGMWVDASEKLEKFGSMLNVDGVLTPSPYLRLVEREREALVKFAAELGLTPVSRSRIIANPPKGRSADPFAEFEEGAQ